MTAIVTRHFVTVGDRQIHYRRAGQGAPVVLLHQSPTSSRECEPLLRRLAEHHSVFAPDMPGDGDSDAMPERYLTIEMLADNVATFMDAVGIGVAGLYGYHTGASVATAFARRHAARVSVAVAVGLLCLTPSERAWLLQNYAPPFIPAWDGSHLAWLWSRLKDQSVFFPWFARSAEGRVSTDALYSSGVHANLPDWLRSGDRYRDAYDAAFRYRPEADLAAIRTPHVVVGFAADPLFKHLERLPAPRDNLEIVRCATALDAQQIGCEALRRFPGGDVGRTAKAARTRAGKLWKDYVTVSGTQLRVLRAGEAAGRPVIVQHGAQSSAAACADLIDSLGVHQPVVAVELPGHGESDALPDPAGYTERDLAELMGAAFKGIGVTEAEVIGIEAGAAIHVALAANAGGPRLLGLVLINAVDVGHDAALSQCLLDSYAVPAPPDFYGGYLLRAWHTARDHLLFFPWTERRRHCSARADPCLDAGTIHRATVDSLFAGDAGCAVRRMEIGYPLLAQLSTVRCAVRFAAPRCHPRFDHTRDAAGRAGRGFLELPASVGAWRPSLTQ